jgi:hypothetical protein
MSLDSWEIRMCIPAKRGHPINKAGGCLMSDDLSLLGQIRQCFLALENANESSILFSSISHSLCAVSVWHFLCFKWLEVTVITVRGL